MIVTCIENVNCQARNQSKKMELGINFHARNSKKGDGTTDKLSCKNSKKEMERQT